MMMPLMKRSRAIDISVYCARPGRVLSSLGVKGKCALSQEEGYTCLGPARESVEFA